MVLTLWQVLLPRGACGLRPAGGDLVQQMRCFTLGGYGDQDVQDQGVRRSSKARTSTRMMRRRRMRRSDGTLEGPGWGEKGSTTLGLQVQGSRVSRALAARWLLCRGQSGPGRSAGWPAARVFRAGVCRVVTLAPSPGRRYVGGCSADSSLCLEER